MEDNFEMGMFDSTQDMELNLDSAPEALKEFLGDDSPITEDEDLNTPPSAEDEAKQITNKNPDEAVEDTGGDSSQGGDSDDKGDDSSNDTSPNPYSSFATVLKEQGLLPSLDLDKNKITDEDSLTEAIATERDTQVKEYLIEKIGEEGFDALEKGVTLAEYQQYQDNVNTLANITEDTIENNLELSKEIILEDYKSQGISEERAQRILSKAIDLGDDVVIEDAKVALTSLKEQQAIKLEKVKEERALEQEKKEAEQDKIDNDLKNSIYKSDEIIEGVKLNKAMQERVYNSITKIVSQSPEGIAENKLMKERRENPIEFDKRMYYLYELTNGFKDFSSLVTKSKSRASSELEEALRKTSFTSNSETPSFVNDPNSYSGNFGDEIVL